MRSILDEHFSPRIAEQLRGKGFEVVAVAERNDLGQMSDEDLLRWSRAAERVLVTHGEPHAGIVLTSPTRFPRSTAGIGTLVIALARLLEERTHTRCLRSEVLWL